jgi:hypothetical protein
MVRRTATTKLEGMWKEAVMTDLKALFRNFPWKTEENHVNLYYESLTPDATADFHNTKQKRQPRKPVQIP